jgi:hypothetical protein
LKNERDRVIGLESKIIPSLRYRLPTSSGAFSHAKNRLEQLDMQFEQATNGINSFTEKY